MPTTADACEELLKHLRKKASPVVQSKLSGDFWAVVERLSSGAVKWEYREELRKIVMIELRALRERMKSGEAILPRLQWYIACHAFLASLKVFHAHNRTKIHHWIPASYIRRFSDDDQVSKKDRRRARVWELAINPKSTRDKLVTSTLFCHPAQGESGFYSQQTELFFSLIEGNASETVTEILRQGKRTPHQLLTAVALALVQQVRAPKSIPIHQFKRLTFRHVINAVGKQIDSLEKLYVYLDETDEKLPFTAVHPVRVQKIGASTQTAWYFPLSWNLALTVSGQKLSRRKRNTAIAGGRAGAISLARRRDVKLYGLSLEELQLGR